MEPLKRRIYWPTLVLSLLGLVVASYLIFVHYHPASSMCFGVGDCEAVNTSPYAVFHGIPIAVFGALAYAVMAILTLLEPRTDLFAEWAPMLVFGIAFAGMLYSAYLTYIELEVLHKVCPYCVTSAITITLITIISIVRLVRINAVGEMERG